MAEADTIAPGLLLAMPQLVDPNFRRTVVLVTAHSPDGAMGFVVNRALPVSMESVLEGLDLAWKGNSAQPVFQGGPVMPQSGWVLFEQPERRIEDAQEVVPGLWLTASIESLRRLALAPPRRMRLLLGYAGWGGGQLESELTDGTWLLVPPTADLLFEADDEAMWEAGYRALGVDPSSVFPSSGVQ
jgi:putative transcriptional regulator